MWSGTITPGGSTETIIKPLVSQWEYEVDTRLYTGDDELKEALNKAGKQGWELGGVMAFDASGAITLLYKRPLLTPLPDDKKRKL